MDKNIDNGYMRMSFVQMIHAYCTELFEEKSECIDINLYYMHILSSIFFNHT